METIKNYLDSIFKGLPDNKEIRRIKDDLYLNMEDKYNELKSNGKSENEAIGIVISEFGNIDELLEEMNIKLEENLTKNSNVVTLKMEEVNKYMSLKEKTSKYIALGVFLILIGVSIMMTLSELIDSNIIFSNYSTDKIEIIPIIVLLFFVGISVTLFISSDNKLKKYKYIEEGDFLLESTTKSILEKNYLDYNNNKVIIGVVLCIIAAIPLFIGSVINEDIGSAIGLSITILIVAIAVVIFILNGTKKEIYTRLLKIEEYKYNKKEDKLVGIVASVVWPIAVCIFLVSGFVYNLWDKAWIIFPVVGILFGGFTSAYSAIKNKN